MALALILGARVGMPEPDLRAFVFTTLALMNVGLIVINRSFRSSLYEAPNPAIWGSVTAALSIVAVAIYWSTAQSLFHFGPLHLDDLSVCLAAGANLIGLPGVAKRFGSGPEPLAGN